MLEVTGFYTEILQWEIDNYDNKKAVNNNRLRVQGPVHGMGQFQAEIQAGWRKD